MLLSMFTLSESLIMKFETFEFVRPEDAFTMYLIAISICKEEVYRALSMPRKA